MVKSRSKLEITILGDIYNRYRLTTSTGIGILSAHPRDANNTILIIFILIGNTLQKESCVYLMTTVVMF